MSQHMDALAKGNEVRLARAELKREVKAGEVALGEYLAEPDLPPWLDAMRVEDLLVSAPRMGSTRVSKLLREVPIKGGATIGDLTYRKRRIVADRLTKLEAAARENAEKRARKRARAAVAGEGAQRVLPKRPGAGVAARRIA